MRLLTLLSLLALAGCSGSLLGKCQTAEASYAVAQIGIEVAVTRPTIDPLVKQRLQEADLTAMMAINICEAAARIGNDRAVESSVATLADQAALATELMGPPDLRPR